MTLSNPAGMFFSFIFQAVFSLAIIKRINVDQDPPALAFKEEIYEMIFVENLFISGVFLFFCVFFTKSAPKTPPSFAAMRNHSSITQGMVQDFKILISNKNFLWMALVYTLVFCVYSGLGIILALVFAPYGFNTFEISLLGMIFVLTGAVACYLMGIYLDRTNKYLIALRYVVIATLVS